MTFTRYAILPLALCAVSGCQSKAEQQADAREDQIERQAEQSAVAAGDAVAALGLTERQLLDADLIAQDGQELGDVEQVRRDASGAVTELLIEIEDSNPDRYVFVPIDGLTVRGAGYDADLQTPLTAQDLAALPEAKVGTP